MKFGFVMGTIVVGIALLTGCGSSSDTSIESINIDGTWDRYNTSDNKKCKNYSDGTSEVAQDFFKGNLMYRHVLKYSEMNCQDDDLFYYVTYEFDISYGSETISKDGKLAYTFDSTKRSYNLHGYTGSGYESSGIGVTLYSMFTLSGNKIVFAATTNERDGSSAVLRANMLHPDYYYHKQ